MNQSPTTTVPAEALIARLQAAGSDPVDVERAEIAGVTNRLHRQIEQIRSHFMRHQATWSACKRNPELDGKALIG